MKLTIVDIGWGIDRRTGARSEQEILRESFEISESGKLPPFGPGLKVFEVRAIDDGKLTIHLSDRAGDVVLGAGETYHYNPMSRDGGHKYDLIVE